MICPTPDILFHHNVKETICWKQTMRLSVIEQNKITDTRKKISSETRQETWNIIWLVHCLLIIWCRSWSLLSFHIKLNKRDEVKDNHFFFTSLQQTHTHCTKTGVTYLNCLALIRKWTVEECCDDIHEGVDYIVFQGSVWINEKQHFNKNL